MDYNFLIKQIDFILEATRNSIISGKPLPFKKISLEFDFNEFRYHVISETNMTLDIRTITVTTRLVALLVIIRSIIEKGVKVTKRSVYYQLLKYYRGNYKLVSKDISILTHTLGVSRDCLNIIASGRGILCGHMTVSLSGIPAEVTPLSVFNLPTSNPLSILNLSSKTIIVVQKQSIFNHLLHQLQNYPDFMLVTSKGYPDYITQRFLKQASELTENIYYIGDMDPYGFDILLEYAVGNGFEGFGVQNINWLDIEALLALDLMDESQLSQDYLPFSKPDDTKLQDILSRDYFSQDRFLQQNRPAQSQYLFSKFQRWKRKFLAYSQLQMKVELESHFKTIKVGCLAGLAILIERGLLV